MKNNGKITPDNNGYHQHRLSKHQEQFLEKARKINEKGQDFCYLDFPELTPENFRQKIYKLRDYIEPTIKSNPTFYKLKDVDLPGSKKRLTNEVTGDSIIPMLSELKDQPPKIHDIKLQFDTDFQSIYLKRGKKNINESNKGTFLKIRPIKDYTVNISIYPKKIQIDIGCSSNPIVYNMTGIIEFTSLLGRIATLLDFQVAYCANIPPVSEWICTHYHFGKDGNVEYNGQMFHRTWKEVAGGLMRLYPKKASDGKSYMRLEKVITPMTSVEEQAEMMLKTELTPPPVSLNNLKN